MDESHDEDKYDQSEEQLVVCLANTVVQPAAVVIKIVNASIASTTMFGSLGHMRLTNITFKVIIRAIKNSPK